MLSETGGEFQGHQHFAIHCDGRVNHSIEDPRKPPIGGSKRSDIQARFFANNGPRASTAEYKEVCHPTVNNVVIRPKQGWQLGSDALPEPPPPRSALSVEYDKVVSPVGSCMP